MFYGQTWGSPWSDPENFLLYLDIDDLINGVQVTFQPAPGYGNQYYQLVIDGFGGSVVFAPENAATSVVGHYASNQTDHIISVVAQGLWPAAIFDNTISQILFQDGRSDHFHIEVPFSYDLLPILDHGQTSNWQLTGIRRFSNCMTSSSRPNWASFGLTLTNDPISSIRTVALIDNGNIVASGTFTGNVANVTLTDLGYGIEGSVTVNYSGEVLASENAQLIARYAAKYNIYFRQTPYVLSDFPMTPDATIFDDNTSNSLPFTSPKLAPGTWYYVIHSVTDAGIEDNNANNQTATTVYVPAAPTNVQLVGGTATSTQISFTASSDSLSTYNIYDSKDTGMLDLSNVSQTVGAGSGTITVTLPSITPNFTGKRFVLVRSLLAGVESGNV